MADIGITDTEIAGYMGWRGPGAYTDASLRKIREIIDHVLRAKRAVPPASRIAPEVDVRHEFELYKSNLGEAANYIGDGLYGNHGVTDQANAFRAGVEVGRRAALAVHPTVSEQAHALAEAAGFTTRYNAGKHVFTGGIEQIERLLAFHPAEKDECRIPLVSIDSLISVAAEIAEREKKHQAAAAETEVLAGAVWNAPTTSSQVDPRQAAPSGRWSEELPIAAGHYWYWNGRCESRPVLLSGTYSHGGQQLVGAGGEPLAMLGGYWWRVHQPPTSSAMTPVLTLQEGNQERHQ